MARPSLQELIAAFKNPTPEFDPSKISAAAIQGQDLADTILARKQAQEDRVRALKEKIDQVKRERTFAKGVQQGPVVANIGGQPVHASETQDLAPETAELGNIASAYPKETAMELLKEKLQAQSEEGKNKRALLKQQQQNEAPDKIKKLFQLADGTTVGVTYGGKIQPISVPNGGNLNPLKKTLPAAEAQQLGDFDTLSSQLQRVKETYKPEYTGPVDSRTGELAQTVDLPSVGLGATPQRSDFLSNINSIRNQLIYLRSGKQINEKEYDRLLSELPNEHRSDVDFAAKLANFEKVFDEIKQNRRNALSTGFNVPSGAAPAANPQIDALAGVLGLKKKGAK